MKISCITAALAIAVGIQASCRSEIIDVPSQTSLHGNRLYVTKIVDESWVDKISFEEYYQAANASYLHFGKKYANIADDVDIIFYASGFLLSKGDFDREAADPRADLPPLYDYEVLQFSYKGNVAGDQGCCMRVRFQINGRHLEAEALRYKEKDSFWWPCPEPDMSE